MCFRDNHDRPTHHQQHSPERRKPNQTISRHLTFTLSLSHLSHFRTLTSFLTFFLLKTLASRVVAAARQAATVSPISATTRQPSLLLQRCGLASAAGVKKRTVFISTMRLYDAWYEILKIQKFRRVVSYAGFYCFASLVTYAYTNNTTRAGFSRGDQFYASYPAGTEMLTDTAKLYKAALGNCFEVEDWGPIEFCVMAKHFERQGKSPYAYHAQYMAHLLSQGQLDGSG